MSVPIIPLLRIGIDAAARTERRRRAELEHATRRLRILASTLPNPRHDRLWQSILPAVHIELATRKGH